MATITLALEPSHHRPDWRRARAQALARDNHECQLRIMPGCTRAATQVHHIRALARGGDRSELTNLVSVCGYCHNVLSSQESARRRNRRRPTPIHPADVLGGRLR